MTNKTRKKTYVIWIKWGKPQKTELNFCITLPFSAKTKSFRKSVGTQICRVCSGRCNRNNFLYSYMWQTLSLLEVDWGNWRRNNDFHQKLHYGTRRVAICAMSQTRWPTRRNLTKGYQWHELLKITFVDTDFIFMAPYGATTRSEEYFDEKFVCSFHFSSCLPKVLQNILLFSWKLKS